MGRDLTPRKYGQRRAVPHVLSERREHTHQTGSLFGFLEGANGVLTPHARHQSTRPSLYVLSSHTFSLCNAVVGLSIECTR